MAWFEHGKSRIYYEDVGSGSPVLLLPGFADTTGNHAALRGRLAANNRVIAADLPGSGSSAPQPRRYHRDFYEDDSRAFIALLGHLEAAPTHVVGFSDGGEVALMIAALAPGMVRSVFTWGAGGGVTDPDGSISANFRKVVDDPIPEFRGFREYLVATYGESVARASTQSFADAIAAIVAAGGEIVGERAERISCPVMLIAGEHDTLVPRVMMEKLARRIRTAQTLEVEGAGHAVHQDSPDWLLRTAAEWVATH